MALIFVTVTLVTDYELDDNDQIIPIESSEIIMPVGAIEEPDITKEGYKIIGWAYYDEYEGFTDIKILLHYCKTNFCYVIARLQRSRGNLNKEYI